MQPERQPYWDDVYPHEILGYAPYDGVLVSRAIVGGHRSKGKYTPAQARRFEAVGARKFLRLDTPEFAHLPIFGDCGAFAYAQEERAALQPAEIAEFYDDCGFTHGCSVDHIIFRIRCVRSSGVVGGSRMSASASTSRSPMPRRSCARRTTAEQHSRRLAPFRDGRLPRWRKLRGDWSAWATIIWRSAAWCR